MSQLATWTENALKLECWLLWLNPGAQGEHLTIQFSWVADWLLLVTHFLPCSLSGRVSPTCVLCCFLNRLMRNDGSVDIFLHGQCGFSSVGSCCFEFTHNKGLLSLLFYFIIFSFKYPVYSDFFRWHSCNVPFADLMKRNWIWLVRRGWKHYWWQLLRRRKRRHAITHSSWLSEEAYWHSKEACWTWTLKVKLINWCCLHLEN